MGVMPRFTRQQLRSELERIARRPIRLTLTSNASNYITFSPSDDPLRVRIQRLFLDAPDDVLVGVGRWLGGRAKRCPKVVGRFINSPPPEVARLAHTRRRMLKPQGRCYHLGRLMEQVNAEYFDGAVTARITWGRRISRRQVRARTLGAYYRGENMIFISPVLDQWIVPEWFVEFTIYHECLHARQSSGDRPHGAEFRKALRRHPHYGAAMQWEKANINLLTGRITDRQRAAYRVEGQGLNHQLQFDW